MSWNKIEVRIQTAPYNRYAILCRAPGPASDGAQVAVKVGPTRPLERSELAEALPLALKMLRAEIEHEYTVDLGNLWKPEVRFFDVPFELKHIFDDYFFVQYAYLN